MSNLVTVMSKADVSTAWIDFDAVLTIEDPAETTGFRAARDRGVEQLILKFDDVVSDLNGRSPPQSAHVAEALSYARRFEGRKLLVHCEMGVSRSAGIALAILAERYGPEREQDAVAHLLSIRPVASCNPRIVAFADGLLERSGALKEAWEAADRKRFSGGFFIPPAPGGASA